VITLEIGVGDLAATRFAISPLNETIAAIRLLAEPGKSAVNAPWTRWAQGGLAQRPVRLARVWPLVVNGLDFYPEFLLPAPALRAPAFGEELDRLRGTPAEAVRASLGRVFDEVPWPASAVELAERPGPSLEEIAGELADFHDRLIAPHWARIRAVLDADIAYRSGVLASGGIRALFGDMHQDIRWNEGMLTIGEPDSRDFRVAIEPGGLVLIPGVFKWPELSVRKATSTQSTINYPARGAATVWSAETGGAPDASAPSAGPAAELLGVTRARLLAALRSPATTTALARALGVTPSAVSQHLTVLCRGGLINRARSGRSVLYQATGLGLALLDPPRRDATDGGMRH
jgi:DNA-binding transcriptional ArsR family regulator